MGIVNLLQSSISSSPTCYSSMTPAHPSSSAAIAITTVPSTSPTPSSYSSPTSARRRLCLIVDLHVIQTVTAAWAVSRTPSTSCSSFFWMDRHPFHPIPLVGFHRDSRIRSWVARRHRRAVASQGWEYYHLFHTQELNTCHRNRIPDYRVHWDPGHREMMEAPEREEERLPGRGG